MDKETLIKVVAMLDARVAKMYYEDMTQIQNDSDSLPWEYDKLAGGVSALMDFSEELQLAIDADIASMETSMGM